MSKTIIFFNKFVQRNPYVNSDRNLKRIAFIITHDKFLICNIIKTKRKNYQGISSHLFYINMILKHFVFVYNDFTMHLSMDTSNYVTSDAQNVQIKNQEQYPTMPNCIKQHESNPLCLFTTKINREIRTGNEKLTSLRDDAKRK